MDFFEAVQKRASVRNFEEREISVELIEKLIEAARWAPSAGNVQPWEFIVVKTPEMKREVSAAAFNQKYLKEASIIIIVCADEKRATESYGIRGKTLYCLQDTAAAIQNMLLAAYSLGLGSCWVGAFNENAVKKVINAPEEMRPVALIPIGYPTETPPERRRRRPLSEITHQERF